MDYRKLTSETWGELDDTGDLISGYKSNWLSLNDLEESNIHIFKDKLGQYHCAVEEKGLGKTDIDDPKVNGLQLQLASYIFEKGKISQFIDLTCSISGYLEEFTEVVREISKLILEDKAQPLDAFNQIINNWISFWANQRKKILSEEDQIGLICELLILDKLCKINLGNALKSWTGPLGEKHDFNFTNWNIEVKGTRKSKKIHTINGIDQLNPPSNKHLAFISFHLTTSNKEHSINLPDLIDTLIKNNFKKKPDLTVRFNELLAELGYSPIDAEEYRRFNVEVIESSFFEVDEAFPKLTLSMLNKSLSPRVSSVKYDISVNGLSGINLENISWGDYFY